MAQELNDELGRLLRERGPIGQAMDKLERQTNVRREHLVYGAAGLVGFLFAMNIMSAFLCQLISTCWGVLGSVRALDHQDPVAMQKWASFWLIYAIVNVFCGWIVRLLARYTARIYLLKFLLLVWCALPIEFNGADYLYAQLLAHRLSRPMGLTAMSAKKSSSPPMPTAGDERREKSARSSVSPERRSAMV
ncbi:receptor expression-enhancing protein 6-like [Amblyomma americanum]|uniref:Receptor expression-enhancing protein n=1 Tax=Amblyomma americanum TaxID=6943 RepID=A0AAQ4DY56_AMBAM